jgi:hypothetical protein
MSTYGDVKTITKDRWSKDYRCPVSNGIRIVEIGLTEHITSRLSVVGNRALISYEGQPIHFMGAMNLATNFKISLQEMDRSLPSEFYQKFIGKYSGTGNRRETGHSMDPDNGCSEGRTDRGQTF